MGKKASNWPIQGKNESDKVRIALFALQDAWPYIHGSARTDLQTEAAYLLREGSPEHLDLLPRLKTTLEKAWPLVLARCTIESSKRNIAKTLLGSSIPESDLRKVIEISESRLTTKVSWGRQEMGQGA